MTRLVPISSGQILTGSLFNEPMRVETVQANGPASWLVGLVGTQSERFRKVTPGHPLFEAIRRHTHLRALDVLGKGATFHSLQHESPARIDFYRARGVDGLGQVVHEQLFAVEIPEGGEPRLHEPGLLGNFAPADPPAEMPVVATLPDPRAALSRLARGPTRPLAVRGLSPLHSQDGQPRVRASLRPDQCRAVRRVRSSSMPFIAPPVTSASPISSGNARA